MIIKNVTGRLVEVSAKKAKRRLKRGEATEHVNPAIVAAKRQVLKDELRAEILAEQEAAINSPVATSEAQSGEGDTDSDNLPEEESLLV